MGHGCHCRRIKSEPQWYAVAVSEGAFNVQGKAKRKLESHRIEALSSIGADRLLVEQMAQRPRCVDDAVDSSLLEKVLNALTTIEERAKSALNVEDLEDLTEDAELQGIFAAHFCPATEIREEGFLVFDQLEGWGIPKTAVKRLRDLFTAKLGSSDPHEARSAWTARSFVPVDS